MESSSVDRVKDPRTYDYSNPTRSCDMVMKGGITSGVVYPFAVCEIAQTFRFRNIGGTSAGAIAASAAAAAEFGRHTTGGGFRRLAELPSWLGSGSNMFNLFQPQHSTRRLYRTLTAPVRHPRRRIVAFVGALIRHFPLWLMIGGAPGGVLVLLAASEANGVLRWWGIISGLGLAVVGMAIASTLGILVHLLVRVPKNLFGLCTGGPGAEQAPRPLTWWLADELDHLAGKRKEADADQPPLTFGDLWMGPDGAGSTEEPWLRLQMMTTSLTQGRPYRLPFSSRVWFFDPEEFRELFPERVVLWMESHPPPPPEDSQEWWALQCKLLEPLRPFPDPANVPVIVATRMSLSFPLLISAVPLKTVDWTRRSNTKSKTEWKRWLKRNASDWEAIRKDKAWLGTRTPNDRPRAETSWFSDGGITSNFPVHFFDAPLPRWPTFALNLQPYHEDYPPTQPECHPNNVWLPKGNEGGIAESWTRIGHRNPSRALLGFLRAIADTMQNWTDNTQLRVPGYRDRVAHIRHSADEGGLNLAMPPDRIASLSERGRCAGEDLVERFTQPARGSEPSWDNHRWVRYRSTMTLIADWLSSFRGAFDEPPGLESPSYKQLIQRGLDDPPTSYAWKRDAQREFALLGTEAIVEVSEDWDGDAQTFAEGTPRPRPEIRVRPPT